MHRSSIRKARPGFGERRFLAVGSNSIVVYDGRQRDGGPDSGTIASGAQLALFQEN